MQAGRLPHFAAIVTWVFLLALGVAASASTAHANDLSIRLPDAAEQGSFNVGTAQATISRMPDAGADGLVWKLDYVVPQATTAGVWAKGFSTGVDASTADLLRLGVKATDPAQLRQIAVAVELKGTAGTQHIPLKVLAGWSFTEQPVDWSTIGTLTEVVILVNPTGNDGPSAGMLWIDGGFARLPILEKLSALVSIRVSGVLLISLLGALVTALPAVLPRAPYGRRWRNYRPAKLRATAKQARAAIWLHGLKRDFVYGTATVFIAGLVFGIYSLGSTSGLAAGGFALGAAVLGAVAADWLKFGLTGKHLTSAEVFQDMFVSGLLAASASSMQLLQAPTTWSELLLLSSPVAAAIALVYHVVNAYRLAASGRHLSPIAGAMILATPYVVGSLLLLESTHLVEGLGMSLTAGALAASPAMLAVLGRVLVVFGFNELAANGLSLATKRTLLRPVTAHLSLLAVATGVVTAPWIAAWGSSVTVASLPAGLRLIATVVTTILSQAGLWAEVYLITGMLLDAIHGKAPSLGSAYGHPVQGLKKGMIYSGTFMGLLYGIDLVWNTPVVRAMASTHPLVLAMLAGALVFPLGKTIIESFDGSQGFFRRVRKSYRNPILYVRGMVVGLGLASAVSLAMAQQPMHTRVWFGIAVGVAAFSGVNFLRDTIYEKTGRGRRQSWRVYLIDSLMGGFIGAAIGFYLDASQVSVVVDKFHRYLSAGQVPEPYGVYPFLSKWGFVNLGMVTGGVSLLFAEALAGVLSWAIPAWLFAINRTVMAAYFQKETSPIKSLFTTDGLAQLTQNMIEVLRWGLWMSPIINSFLRPMGDPTWYNQDGAIRTLLAIFQDATMSPAAFHAWSLQVFVSLLAYDVVRILIWLDHMGLRVATLVNLSFLGMDRLDQRLARFLGPAASARCIPEAVKRFTTWAPLLIPFYIPRGHDWDLAWSQAQAIQAARGGTLASTLLALPLSEKLLLLATAIVASTAVFSAIRWLRSRSRSQTPKVWSLANTEYEVTLKESGELFSQVRERGYDVSRRSYDFLDPAGRTLFLVDDTENDGPAALAWPVIGNYPRELAHASSLEQNGDSLRISNTANGIRTTIEITLAGPKDPAELWTVTVENLSTAERHLKLVPYLEWVLNRPDTDRGHTQYNRLFAEMEYSKGLHAVLAWDKHSKAMGILAANVEPSGFLTSRIDFIGRARSLWNPRVLETLEFFKADETEAHPTFDPIGSLLVRATVAPGGSTQIRLLIGLTKNKKQAIDLIARHLRIPGTGRISPSRKRKSSHAIAHGEIPPGTPQPYSEFSADGRTLRVHTPFTPRPYDHTMSNGRGHVVAVTNRGLHTTSSGNSQQNRLTPDWPDIVTREVPAEAFYLYDLDNCEWYSPTYHPLNDRRAHHEVEFGVDGTATYHMTRGTLATELTVFVPPEEPTGVYLLTVRNRAEVARRIRVAPYFQMVLANQPEHAGPLKIYLEKSLHAVFFENPRNTFRTGPAFVAMSRPAEQIETNRGRFFGTGRSVAHPYMVEQGQADATQTTDNRPIAGFVDTLEIPAHGECTVAVILGQADNRQEAEAVIRKYQDLDTARASLEATRKWWLGLMSTVRVESNNLEFDHYLYWLKYQALAERIWARRGFYQASGAFGFRDQLQDSVNLVWMDPSLARRQILLHAAQQFIEGDVVHWFHRLQDGRTGFAARTHASDNLLWLAWAVGEYVGATGDRSILDERTPYLEAEQPLRPLPAGKHGMGFEPLRSARVDSVYQHCMKAIDLVLDKRLGAHGLPLIGTGDWNDGLDEIGSQGRGESVWLGFFLYYILDRMNAIIAIKEGDAQQAYYRHRAKQLKDALEQTWRGDRYLRAIHDDGTEIGVDGSGVWEIDALTAAWAVMSGINPQRGRIVFDTAVRVLERENTVLLGWPALREDTRPYLGRSSWYPEGVRENGMYSHGVQWLVGAARILAGQFQREGQTEQSRRYHEAAYRLWRKISPIPHVVPGEIETYGGQPNKQAADMLTACDPGRMIWHGYTGAAGWLLRQAMEGVLGLRLVDDRLVVPIDLVGPAGSLGVARIWRNVTRSPLQGSLKGKLSRSVETGGRSGLPRFVQRAGRIGARQ